MDFLKKIDAYLPVVGKTIFYTLIGARAKMLGKTYVDVLNLLHYEFTLPETEDTWKKRQDLLVQLSEIFENRKDNNVPLPKDFVERVKAILPEILGAALSERTTLSAQACRTVSNIIKHLETQLLPQIDILLPQLITHCGSTKNVNQKNASDAITAVCKHAGYSPRLFYHVSSAFRDKRTPPRIYAPEWLRILIQKYRAQMDRERDGELARKAIYQGLTDGQVKVRENSRAVYWEYATYDVQGARMIMGGLNPHAQAALRDDPHNPDRPSSKGAKVARPDSALASIKAQSKQRLQQRRGFTPASIKPEDFVFGSLEDLDAGAEKHGSQKSSTEHAAEKHGRHNQESTHATHQHEVAGASRHGASTQSRPTSQKSSKDSKLDSVKDLDTASPQVDARPLLSAPVRRGRIVATPIAPVSNAAQRPGSRGEATKKPLEARPKPATEKPSGRQTPVSHREKEAVPSTVGHHRKTASRHETLKAEDKEFSNSNPQHTKRSGRQTPVIAEDKEPSAPPTIPTTKKTERHSPVIVEDKPTSAPALSKSLKESSWQDSVSSEQSVPSNTMPLRSVKPFAPENQAIPSMGRAVDKDRSRPHIAEGKENTNVLRPRKKQSPSRSPTRSPNRSPQRSPRRNSIASAKKSLTMAMEFLRHRSLDALGYRRLKKLVENHPGVLITRHAQFNELFELLITNLSSFDEISESRDKRPGNFNHPAYSRHTILITLIHLFQQYPQWPEPQPGMTLCALLVARCNHTSGYASVLQAIDDSAYLLCAYSQNPLPTIDAVLDTLEQIEYIITTNDPIVTPNSGTTIFYNSLQSLASEFGPDRPRFANRLPHIMAFGLQVLNHLLARLVDCNQTLFTMQEDRLMSFAEHLLATYTSLIKRRVMDYCIALHSVIKPEKRFYNYFSKESDKNLIHYYVAGASGMVTGSLGNMGRVVMPESDLDYMESEPSTFDAGSEASANWKVLGTTAMDRVVAQGPGNTGMNALGMGASNVAASDDSGNWQVLGVTIQE